MRVILGFARPEFQQNRRAVSDSRIDMLARVLVRYSVGVRPGNLVSLVGPPQTEPLVIALYREVLQAGGHPLVLMTPEACTEELYRHGSAEQLSFVNPLDLQEVALVDATVHIGATLNTRALTNIPPQKQALRSQARKGLM